MDPSSVVIRYSPSRWTELETSDNIESPSKIVTFNYGKQGLSEYSTDSRSAHLPQMPRKRHLTALSNSSFERPVAESLRNLSEYANILKLGAKPVKSIEQDWYHDLTNVGQRLKFLRDTFKVIQSARKRKMMGQRADFRTHYDAKVSRTGSPLLSDDERNPSDDDTPKTASAAVPAPNAPRRGRPRKYRGRVKKTTLSRADVTVKRTRASRRIEEAPSSTSGAKNDASSTSSNNLRDPAPAELPPPKRRGRWANRKPAEPETNPPSPTSEPQGPPLTHSPPILPSQRLPAVQSIPSYRHIATSGVPPTPAYSTVAYKESKSSSEKTSGSQGKLQPFLPSQVSYPVASYAGNGSGTQAYLPSQAPSSGSYSYAKYPPAEKPAIKSPAYPIGYGTAGYSNYSSTLSAGTKTPYAAPVNSESWTPKSLGQTVNGREASEEKSPRFQSIVSKSPMPVSGISQGSSFPRIDSTSAATSSYGSWPSVPYTDSIKSHQTNSRLPAHHTPILHSSGKPIPSNPVNAPYAGHSSQPHQPLPAPLAGKPEYKTQPEPMPSTQFLREGSLGGNAGAGPQGSSNHLPGRAPESLDSSQTQSAQPIQLSQIAPELRSESADSLGMTLPSLQALENEIQQHQPAGHN